MRAVTLCAAIVLLGIAGAMLFSEYHIPLSSRSALFSNTEGRGTVFLTSDNRQVLDDIDQYGVENGIVVGTTAEVKFIITSAGEIRTQALDAPWTDLGVDSVPDLSKPSRFHDPTWLTFFVPILAAALGLLTLTLLVCPRVSPRHPSDSPPP